MADYTVKRIDEMEGAYGGAFKRARAELGVSSFGMAIIDMPPNFEHYPTHDHARDGQEEVFLTLRGGGEIDIAGERHPLDADHAVRVAAGTDRKVLPGARRDPRARARREARRGLRGARRLAPRRARPDGDHPVGARRSRHARHARGAAARTCRARMPAGYRRPSSSAYVLR